MSLLRNSINQSLENFKEGKSTQTQSMKFGLLIYKNMQSFSKDNNGIKNLLIVIDIFSKLVWIIPLKRKTGQEVANAFSRILKERRPKIKCG